MRYRKRGYNSSNRDKQQGMLQNNMQHATTTTTSTIATAATVAKGQFSIVLHFVVDGAVLYRQLKNNKKTR